MVLESGGAIEQRICTVGSLWFFHYQNTKRAPPWGILSVSPKKRSDEKWPEWPVVIEMFWFSPRFRSWNSKNGQTKTATFIHVAYWPSIPHRIRSWSWRWPKRPCSVEKVTVETVPCLQDPANKPFRMVCLILFHHFHPALHWRTAFETAHAAAAALHLAYAGNLDGKGSDEPGWIPAYEILWKRKKQQYRCIMQTG